MEVVEEEVEEHNGGPQSEEHERDRGVVVEESELEGGDNNKDTNEGDSEGEEEEPYRSHCLAL